MLIFTSLFLLFLAGLALCGTHSTLFNLETSLSSGKLQLWMMSVKAFGIPLSLLLLRFTKNHFVKLGSAFWGIFLTFLSLLLIFQITDASPSVNLYGVLLIVGVLICSLSVAIFSLVELSKILEEKMAESKKDKSVPNPENLIQVEGANQPPTNPS